MKLLMLIILISLVGSANAAVVYPFLDCEKVAKEKASELNMKLVFIAEQTESGAWKQGEYVGHWLNMKEIHSKKYYVDFTYSRIFTSKEQVSEFWSEITSYNGKNRNNEVFVYGEDRMPYRMIWHYNAIDREAPKLNNKTPEQLKYMS